MNQRITELEMRMDCCKHGREWPCWMCEEESYDLRHRQLVGGVIGFAIFSFLFFAFAVSCDGAISERFLDTLPIVESNNLDSMIGADGELGRYQFKRIAWDQVNKLLRAKGVKIVYNFGCATEPDTARYYARKYCEWIERELTRALGRRPTAGEIYAAYNLGPRGFERRGNKLPRCPRSTRDAAKRLEALL